MSFTIGEYDAVKRVNFLYNVPRIIFGAGSIEKISDEIKRLGAEEPRILLISDKGVEKAGIVNQVKEILDKANFNVEIYSKLEGEPTLESMKKPIEIIRDTSYQGRGIVIGLGGGSVIDTAKLTALLATNPGYPANYFTFPEYPEVKNPPIPKILISTTAGTGSEVTYFVVARSANGLKDFFTSPYAIADVAIIDPLLHLSCPPKITAMTGLDALAHAVEAFLVTYPTTISDAFALHAIKLVANNLRQATLVGSDIKARHNMAIAASLGGWSIVLIPSTNIGHCISEVIGPKYQIPHGVASGIVTPFEMEFNMPACIDRLNLIAECFGVDTNRSSKREAAKKGIEAIKDLIRDIDIPLALKEYGVPKDDIPELARFIVEKRQNLYDLETWNPRKLTIENVTTLLNQMWNGT